MTSASDQQTEQPAAETAAAFGAVLKAKRSRTRRSLEAVGRRAGLSTSTLSRYERGECVPSEEQLTTICDALEISGEEGLQLLDQCKQARITQSAERQDRSPTRSPRPQAAAVRIRRQWRTTTGLIVIGVALIGAAAVLGYLAGAWQASPVTDQAGHYAGPTAPTDRQLPPGATDCGHYTVAAKDLYRRDLYGTPIDQLPQEEVLTVIQRVHPRGLPYWKVTTKANQEGWVDFHHLRPACE